MFTLIGVFLLLLIYIAVDTIIFKIKQTERVFNCEHSQRFPVKQKHLKYWQ